MCKRLVIVFCLCFFTIALLSPVFADDSDDAYHDSLHLIKMGLLDESRGDFGSAVINFQEAFEVYPKNVLPLLYWGRVIFKAGMYERAKEILEEIPLEQLPELGQSEVNFFLGRISLAMGNFEEAAIHFESTVKTNSGNSGAKLRLGIICALYGMYNKASECTLDLSTLSKRENLMALILNLFLGNFDNAYKYAVNISKLCQSYKPDISKYERFLSNSFVIFLLLLPLSLSTFFLSIYQLFLILLLIFVLTRFFKNSTLVTDVVFLVLSFVILRLIHYFSINDYFTQIMLNDLYLYESIWILPRLSVLMHHLTIFFIILFPFFSFVSDYKKPLRAELYAIWFFSLFLGLLILVFQSNMTMGYQVLLCAVCFALTFITSLFIPLGSYTLYRVASFCGFNRILDYLSKDIENIEEQNLVNAKIVEYQALKSLNAEQFSEVISCYRKLMLWMRPIEVPELYFNAILSMLISGDYFLAAPSIEKYLNCFEKTDYYEHGKLLEALLRVFKGEEALAMNIVSSFSSSKIKLFNNDQQALCLYILGCSDLKVDERIQAHIDFSKALEVAKAPFIISIILLELAKIDLEDKMTDKIEKWVKVSDTFAAGPLSFAVRYTLESKRFLSNAYFDEALVFAEKATSQFAFPAIVSWYAFLLCKNREYLKAEGLLKKLHPESFASVEILKYISHKKT